MNTAIKERKKENEEIDIQNMPSIMIDEPQTNTKQNTERRW